MSIAAESETFSAHARTPGDHAPVEALHREFYDRLVRLCAHRLKDPSLAEDIAQETMLRALRFWASYDADLPTWPWLKAIALRLCIDAYHARSHEVCLDGMTDRAGTPDETEVLLDEIALRRAMAALPERQRIALRLRYFDDRDRVSSAEVLGLNVNAFDQLLSRARLRLATAMGPAAIVLPFGWLRTPMRWWRRRPVRRARGGFASAGLGAATTASLALTPLLAIVGGMTPQFPSPADARQQLQLSAHANARPAPADTRAVRAAAPANSGASSQHAGSMQVGTAAGPASVDASLSKHPLGKGQVERDRITLVTPVTTVTVGGGTDHTPEPGVVCNLPNVQCSH